MSDDERLVIIEYLKSIPETPSQVTTHSSSTTPLPRWLEIHDLDDLKMHLVRIVIAVLAVLFLREAVEQTGKLDLFKLAAALSLIIAVLTRFLSTGGARKG